MENKNSKKAKLGYGLDWSELSKTQKKNRIYHVLKATSIAYWRMCSKSKQLKYIQMITSEDCDYDSVREEIYNGYLKSIDWLPFEEKQLKFRRITGWLGYKGEKND